MREGWKENGTHSRDGRFGKYGPDIPETGKNNKKKDGPGNPETLPKGWRSEKKKDEYEIPEL